MAEIISVVDGKLSIVKAQDVVTTTMSKDEIIGKIAEVQTSLDHLMIDVAAKQAEIAKWNTWLGNIEKVVK